MLNLRILKRHTGYGRVPKTAKQALEQARDLLAEEGKDHWVKKLEFRRHGGVQPENPYCGNWGVCAVGAVGAVCGTLSAYAEDEDADTRNYATPVNAPKHYANSVRVYNQAVELLDKVSGASITAFNDTKGRKRSSVLKAFDRAIQAAE